MLFPCSERGDKVYAAAVNVGGCALIFDLVGPHGAVFQHDDSSRIRRNKAEQWAGRNGTIAMNYLLFSRLVHFLPLTHLIPVLKIFIPMHSRLQVFQYSPFGGQGLPDPFPHIDSFSIPCP